MTITTAILILIYLIAKSAERDAAAWMRGEG